MIADGGRVLLLGATGQIGAALAPRLSGLGEVVAPTHQELSLVAIARLRDAVREIRPALIVNAAAYTDVNRAESDRDAATAANVAAPGALAEEAARLDAILVHYSTDYVFDGAKRSPYREDDEPGPLNVYGRTKLDGERSIEAAGARHLIFRTSWVYSFGRSNFLLAMSRALRERDSVSVVADQNGAPSWSEAIAEASTAALSVACGPGIADPWGTYHMTAGGATTWYGFASAIASHLSPPIGRLVPVTTEEFGGPVVRPKYSVLDNGKLNATLGVRLGPWQDQLLAAFESQAATGSPFD